MAAELYVVVTPNSAAARAAVYGSAEEAQHFATAVAAKAPLPIAGGVWGPPAVSAGTAATAQCAWGVWATLDGGTLLASLQALATASTVTLFTWDPATGETLEQFTARWQVAVSWQLLEPGVTAALVPRAAAVA